MRKKISQLAKIDRGIFLTVLILMVFGVIAVSSASTVLSFERFGHNNYYFFRQAIFAAIGFLLIYIFSRVDYRVWRRWARPILLVAIALLGAVLIPGVGFRVGNAARWINAGFFLIQPSEFVKLALIFFLASWFDRKKGAEDNLWFGVLPPVLVAGVVMGLVVIEPDVGAAAMMGVILMVILFAVGVKLSYLTGLVAAGVVALWILIKAAPYRAARIITFLDPSVDPQGIGYHINQALLAIGAGGLWGYGFGSSLQKHNYLPEPIGDSIFAVLAEELGFLRIMLLVLLFFVLAFLGLRLAGSAPDRFSRLTVIGIVGWIFFQALINIGAISGILPLTGISLPFISYGGSSLLVLSMAVGVLLNISRHRV